MTTSHQCPQPFRLCNQDDLKKKQLVVYADGEAFAVAAASTQSLLLRLELVNTEQRIISVLCKCDAIDEF